MTDGQLRARVRAYERERAWAPRWVDDDLAATHERRARAAADATLWTARADAPDTTPTDAARLHAATATARVEAQQLTAQIAELEAVDQAWAQWYAHTAVTRDLADRARIELRARGIDPDDPPDCTTAPDWLAAQRAAQAEHDRHTEITEADVHDSADEHYRADQLDERAAPPDDPTARDLPDRREDHPETGVADLRDIAAPDATETADPAQRRRVLTIDETTQAVTRAQTALAEIAARRAADAERVAAEAERAEVDDKRRDQLTRWADTDTAPDVRDHTADSSVPTDAQRIDEGAVLER